MPEMVRFRYGNRVTEQHIGKRFSVPRVFETWGIDFASKTANKTQHSKDSGGDQLMFNA